MMTLFVISYISTWGSIIYSYLTAKNDVELWDKKVE
ncbi:hypothetical protein CLV62_1266 [Dysgonomonas alginatilytica]|uniref:Uncharacterized protein n=1 Tax=Dysgonomonas alginatilytica TaxID=1605892 RepID=A0A2V3PKR3_9BACT|nr:hypothetical protein CLV62_1266 [Dysgonomonas alginatilytica]